MMAERGVEDHIGAEHYSCPKCHAGWNVQRVEIFSDGTIVTCKNCSMVQYDRNLVVEPLAPRMTVEELNRELGLEEAKPEKVDITLEKPCKACSRTMLLPKKMSRVNYCDECYAALYPYVSRKLSVRIK